MDPWIPFWGSLFVALIAATAATYQTRRNHRATRELEQEKARIARRESEWREIRERKTSEEQRREAEMRQYQQRQALPFLEGLADLIDKSYRVAHIAPVLKDVGGHLPHVRTHADRSVAEFMQSFASVSGNRAQLFLALRESDLEPIADRLEEFSHSIQKLLKARSKLWSRAATHSDVWEAQRDVVKLGYLVMMDIHRAASNPAESASSDESRRNAIAHRMVSTFEEFSSAVVPFGARREYSWTGLWEVDKRQDHEEFVKSMGEVSLDSFLENWKAFGHALGESNQVIDIKMGASRSELQDVYWIYSKFAGSKSFSTFTQESLPALRETHSTVWSLFRSPIELFISDNPADAPSQPPD